MRRPWTVALPMLAGLLLLATEQTAAQHHTGRSVNGAGGGAARNEVYLVNATAGQAIVGRTSAHESAAQQGFWGSTRKDVLPESATPSPGAPFVRCVPNPFAGSAALHVSIPHNGRVVVNLYDVRGTLVRTLVDENRQAGAFKIELSSEGISSGVYSAELVFDGDRTTTIIGVMK